MTGSHTVLSLDPTDATDSPGTCGNGADVFLQVVLTQTEAVYLQNRSGDSTVGYRSRCDEPKSDCGATYCGVAEWLGVLGAGRHFFSIEVGEPLDLDIHHLPVDALDAPRIQTDASAFDTAIESEAPTGSGGGSGGRTHVCMLSCGRESFGYDACSAAFSTRLGVTSSVANPTAGCGPETDRCGVSIVSPVTQLLVLEISAKQADESGPVTLLRR
jgi:hypothetical protein